MKKIREKRGISILGVLFLGFLIVLVLSYFNVSVKNIIESPTGQENINYIKGETKDFWDTYLAKPANYVWNDIIKNIFWKSFTSNMERIRNGEPTDFEKAADKIKVNIAQ
jgi:hypothetical protein